MKVFRGFHVSDEIGHWDIVDYALHPVLHARICVGDRDRVGRSRLRRANFLQHVVPGYCGESLKRHVLRESLLAFAEDDDIQLLAPVRCSYAGPFVQGGIFAPTCRNRYLEPAIPTLNHLRFEDLATSDGKDYQCRQGQPNQSHSRPSFHVIVIGKGQNESMKTTSVITATTTRVRPSGSIS